MGSKERHNVQTSSSRRGGGGLPRMVSSRRMMITGKLTGGSTRFLSRLASARSLGVDSGDGATETSSVCSSVCNKSLDSAMQHTGITISANSKKKKKQRVRFNDNKFTGKNQVNSTVISIERVGDRDRSDVWWTAKEIWSARSEEAVMAENNDEAIAYLSASFQVFLRVTAEDREDVTKWCTPNAQDLAACLDARYRGLERWHGPSSVDRKFRCEQVTQDIVRMYRKSIKQQQQNNKKEEDEDEQQDADERVRLFAHNLTCKMQNLARFYGKIDSLGVNNTNTNADGKDDNATTATTTKTTAGGESSAGYQRS